jgi:hypothetical protein
VIEPPRHIVTVTADDGVSADSVEATVECPYEGSHGYPVDFTDDRDYAPCTASIADAMCYLALGVADDGPYEALEGVLVDGRRSLYTVMAAAGGDPRRLRPGRYLLTGVGWDGDVDDDGATVTMRVADPEVVYVPAET